MIEENWQDKMALTLQHKIDIIMSAFNEVAFGYDDCGCFWRIQYGRRGSGGMIDGIGRKFNSESSDFEEAVDEFMAAIVKPRMGLSERKQDEQPSP